MTNFGEVSAIQRQTCSVQCRTYTPHISEPERILCATVPTIIFDEIDTGIGGSTSDAVGKRLKTLSQNSQILVVTHQPQIASKADAHLKISKSEIAGKVKTKIEILDKNSRINEIARMLSGEEISLEAMSASKKLLEENNTK